MYACISIIEHSTISVASTHNLSQNEVEENIAFFISCTMRALPLGAVLTERNVNER